MRREFNYEIRLWNAQDGCCFHCGEKMLMTSARKLPNGQYDNGWTREHVVPRKLGGKRQRNIVLAHVKCNSSRGHQPPGPGDIQRCKELWRRIRP